MLEEGIPIDWLAANGLTSRDHPTQQERVEAPVEFVRSRANQLKKEKAISLSTAYHEISRALGFKNWNDYVDHMKSTHQWISNTAIRKRKRRIRDAKAYSGGFHFDDPKLQEAVDKLEAFVKKNRKKLIEKGFIKC